MQEYVERFIAEKINEGKEHAAIAYRTQLARFVAAGVELRPPSIKEWLMKIPNPATRNRYRAALYAFCRWLQFHEVIPTNPVAPIRAWSEARPVRYWEIEAVRRVLAWLPPPYRAPYALAAGAGAELAALKHFTPADVQGDAIQLRGTKTPWRTRVVRILWPDVAAVFQQHVSLWGDVVQLRQQLYAAAVALNLPRLTLHDQRHTFAVNALRAGFKPELIAYQLGHSDTTLLWRRYGRYWIDERDYNVRDLSAHLDGSDVGAHRTHLQG